MLFMRLTLTLVSKTKIRGSFAMQTGGLLMDYWAEERPMLLHDGSDRV